MTFEVGIALAYQEALSAESDIWEINLIDLTSLGTAMKKAVILSLILMNTLTSQVFADQVVCRGSETTMVMTDMNGQDEANFVYVEVWTAQYDQAKYADLFSEALSQRVKSVTDLLTQNTFTVSGARSSKLQVDLKNKSLSLRAKNGATLKDKFNCKAYKLDPITPSDFGG